ncbi:MAG TPA: DUF2089 domain-containing protein [Limnochordia bacterium]|nr:DUF2089 domain-containing protein [Limnochordia bacterium]
MILERLLVSKCPVCGNRMDIIKLHCKSCDTTLAGRFAPCKFCQLTTEQQQFVEVFLASRGNIKEVERLLGMSYPTVRSRLDQVIESLGYRVEHQEADSHRKEILKALNEGEITAEEAIKLLKK